MARLGDALGVPLAPAGLPNSTQPTDQHGVEGERHWPVENGAELLVVAGGGDPEALPDGALLGHRERLALEGQQGPRPIVKGSIVHERSLTPPTDMDP